MRNVFNNIDGSRLLKKLLCLSATVRNTWLHQRDKCITFSPVMMLFGCVVEFLFLIKSKTLLFPCLSAVWLVSLSLNQDSGQSVSFLQRTVGMYCKLLQTSKLCLVTLSYFCGSVNVTVLYQNLHFPPVFLP